MFWKTSSRSCIHTPPLTIRKKKKTSFTKRLRTEKQIERWKHLHSQYGDITRAMWLKNPKMLRRSPCQSSNGLRLDYKLQLSFQINKASDIGYLQFIRLFFTLPQSWQNIFLKNRKEPSIIHLLMQPNSKEMIFL